MGGVTGPERVTGRPWWRVIGPWPIRPGLLTVVGLMYYLTFRAGQDGGLILQPSTAIPILVPGALAGLGVYAIGWVCRAWQHRSGVHWGNYLVALLAITAFTALLRINGLIGIEVEGAGANVQVIVRFLLTVVVTSAVAGTVVDRLERQVDATEAALSLAREQQIQLITADEEARRQVATFLHDRVQSALLVNCLELRAAAEEGVDRQQATLLKVAEQLEQLRAIDVRRAARALSPHLDDVDLRTAIEDLASQYDNVFTTDIELDAALERNLQKNKPVLALAIYRIVEQALLNVAAHAQASHVRVGITRSHDGMSVTVADDGRGLPSDPGRGLGSTIITTWVRALGGTWTLSRSPDGWTRLQAQFPTHEA